jgi:outer membrane immunogenic protein
MIAKQLLHAGAALMALTTGPAIAADQARPAPSYKAPPPAPLAFSWTGCYLGGQGGYAWGRSKDIAESGATAGLDITQSFSLSGGMAGGTVGCNYQMSNVVFGVEDDMSWTNQQGSSYEQLPFNVLATSQTREKWIDTFRGRIGFAWDRTMLYVTGGGAVAKIGDQSCNTAAAVCVSDSANKFGWTVGFGAEWNLWDRWSFKTEYLHVDLGTTTFINPQVSITGLTFVTRNVPVTDDIVRAGLNYRFGWGEPVIAKY